MKSGAEAWRIWTELRHLEDLLSYGGAVKPGAARFDSLGRPLRSRLGAKGGADDYDLVAGSRIQRVQYALRHAGPRAEKRVCDLMQGLELEIIWPALLAVCEEIVLLRGVAAAPGLKRRRLAAPAFDGVQTRQWLVDFIALSPRGGDSSGALIPTAFRNYERGFRQAWGPTRDDRRRPLDVVNGVHGNVLEAALDLSKGHVMLVGVLLTLLASHLARHDVPWAARLEEIGRSERLGPLVSDWAAQHGEHLVGRFRPLGAAPNAPAPPRPAVSA